MTSNSTPNANMDRGRLPGKNRRMNLTIDTKTAASLRPPERPKFPFSSPITDELSSPENSSIESGSSGSGGRSKHRLVGRLSGMESGTSLSKNEFERALYEDLSQPKQQQETMHWSSSNPGNKQSGKRMSGIMKRNQRPTGLQVVTNFSRNLDSAKMSKKKNDGDNNDIANRVSRSLIDLNGLKHLARTREKERLKEILDRRTVRAKASNDGNSANHKSRQQRGAANYTSPQSLQAVSAPTSELSPSDGSLVIGLRVPYEDPTSRRAPVEHTISHDNAHTPATPSILITPAKEDSPWTPDSPAELHRPRVASSVYSQPTPRIPLDEDVPPVPAIPAFHSMVRGHDADQILSAQNTPSLRTERPMSADTVFEDEESPRNRRRSYSAESKKSILSKLSLNTAEANRHQSQGWWTYLLSPLLKRSSTISSRRTVLSPEQPPSVPPLSATSVTFKDSSIKGLSEKETSHFSPDTPEDDMHRQATRDVWSSLDKETLNGSVPPTRENVTRSVFHTGNGVFPNYELHGAAAEYYQASAHDLYNHEPYFECIGHVCSMTTAKRRAELMNELVIKDGELDEKISDKGLALSILLDILADLKNTSISKSEKQEGTKEVEAEVEAEVEDEVAGEENEKEAEVSENPFLDKTEKSVPMEGSRDLISLDDEMENTHESPFVPAPRSVPSPKPSYHSPPPPPIESSRGFDRDPIQEPPQAMPAPREAAPIPMPMPSEPMPPPPMPPPPMPPAPIPPAQIHPAPAPVTMPPVIMYPPVMHTATMPPPMPPTTTPLPIPPEPIPEPVSSTRMPPATMPPPMPPPMPLEPNPPRGNSSREISLRRENPFDEGAEEPTAGSAPVPAPIPAPTPAIRRPSPAAVPRRSPPSQEVSRDVAEESETELPPYSAPAPSRNIPRYRSINPPTYTTPLQPPPTPGPVSPGLQHAMSSRGGIPMSEVSRPQDESDDMARHHPGESHYYRQRFVTAAEMRRAEELEARRQRQEKEDSFWKKLGGLWRGRGCIPKKGCFGRGGREGRKRRRWYCAIVAFCIAVIIISVVLAISLTHKVDSTPVNSQWLNLTGYPPMPTGVMTVAGPDPAVERSSCVAPSQMWSCALPKEQQSDNTGYAADRPNFRFEISFQNGSYPNSTTVDNSTTTATASKRSFLLFGRSDTEPSPSPAVPRLVDQTFLGNTTDNITTPFAGEDTPFYITFLSPVDTSNLKLKVKRDDGDTGITATATVTSSPSTTSSGGAAATTTNTGALANIANLIPAPAMAADGTASAATLYPLPVAQPVRLYNRGLPTEHYGFYTYFDRRIFMKSNVSLTGDGDLKDTDAADLNGGSTKDEASAQCTWSQTRFLVRIWTQPTNVSHMAITASSSNSTNTTATASSTSSVSSSSSATNFTSPGSFPYPITLTVDRHGGLATEKLIYCYGIEEGGYYNLTTPKLEDEDRSSGGTIIQQSPGYVALAEAVQEGVPEDQIDPVDGGTGGCECEWRNWITVS